MNQKINFTAYGVTLRSLLPDDLEFLRAKRNDPEMRKWMTTDHEITSEEMSAWYFRLSDDAFYLLVYFDGKCVGHTNAKPKGDGKYEPGYMFWDVEFKRQGGSVRAVMAFFNYMFDVVHAGELDALTACDNLRALRLAKGLGFVSKGVIEIDARPYEQLLLNPQEYARVRSKYEVLFQ